MTVATMTKKERVRAAIAGEPVDHPPVSLWGHDFLREWTPDELVANTLDNYRPYDWDFIKFNPRATYFAEAWGNTYGKPSDQRQPAPLSHVITEPTQLADLRPAVATGGEGVFGEHLRALGMLLHGVKEDVDVLHTIFSPLSVVAMLCGTPQKFIEFARAEPEGAHTALRAATETLSQYARASVEEGASGIFYAPLTWASRDTCDEAFYEEYGRRYDLEVLKAAENAEFNVMHVCRNNNMIESLLDYPVAAFNWADHGEGNPSLGDVHAKTKSAVMGGVDNAHIHKMSAGDVASQAREAMAATGGRAFITAGCAIAPQTPAANRAALVNAVRG